MFSVGKTAQITAEMTRYGIGILGISECRWSGFGRLKARTGKTIIYSGRDDDVHQWGRNNHDKEGHPMFRQLETDK